MATSTTFGRVATLSAPALGSSTTTSSGNPTKFRLEVNPDHGYQIQEHERPPLAQPFDNTASLIAHIATWIGWLWYFRLRICTTLASNDGVLDWVLLGCELIFLLPDLHTAVELSVSLLPGGTRQSRPLLRLVGTQAPMVHVLVTCCGEDVEVIMDTAAAAAAQDYPKGRFAICLLDDANSTELHDAVKRFNSSKAKNMAWRELDYLARTKVPGKPHYYKAGNLHYGLNATSKDTKGSDFFAALDADMIPERDWLSRTVPHLLKDPDLAMVGPPQISYNIPPGDLLSQDSNVFAKVTEPVHDRFDASQCSGSGYVMRRAALDQIGGWPLVNVGEDIVCSYLLTGAGWKCAFIEDQLQYGLAPSSFESYVSQRIRWSNGSSLVAKQFRFFLPFRAVDSHRLPAQRTFAMLHAFKPYMSPLTLLVAIVVPATFASIALTTSDTPPVARETYRIVFAGLWIASALSRQLIYGSLGSRNLINMARNRWWTTPYTAVCALRSIFSDASHLSFKVTGAHVSAANERSAQHRQPILQRMTSRLMLLHQAYCFISSVALCLWLAHINTARTQASLVTITHRFAYTGLVLRLVDVVWAASVPVTYMAFPPTVPEREELLRVHDNGVKYPKTKGWVKRDGGLLSKLVVDLMVILYLDWL